MDNERIYNTVKFRTTCSSICVSFLKIVKELSSLGYEYLEYDKKKYRVDGNWKICSISFIPLKIHIVCTEDEYPSILASNNKLSTLMKNHPKYKSSRTEFVESSLFGKVYHQFIMYEDKCVIDPTFVQYNGKGKNGRKIGIFNNLKEYYDYFHAKDIEFEGFESGFSIDQEYARNYKYGIDGTIQYVMKYLKNDSICNWCGKYNSKSRRCGKCKSVFYCKKFCQIRDWKCGHKSNCVKK